MLLEVMFATLVLGLVIAAFDHYAALIYVLVLINAGSLYNWFVLNLAFLVFFLVKGVARALRD